MRRIAVWNTAFLGDAVLTLPLAQSLGLRYPDADIDLYVRTGLEPLFAPHPALSAVYGVDKRAARNNPKKFWNAYRDISGRSYDLWISAHRSLRSGLAALASRAPLRIGYDKGVYSRLCYTEVVDRHFGEFDEIERLLLLLGPLGPGPVSDWPEIALDPGAAADADAFFAGLTGPVLGLHPGSVWATKRWPAAYFADVGARAAAAGAHVALFAGPGEETIAHAVRERILAKISDKGRLHDLSGKLPLPKLAAYLGRLSCYLTNDSGPMHLAWSQRTPVTAIFGPTVRAHGFYPRGAGATVFETAEPCRPCGLHGHTSCPLGHHRCMTEIQPGEVWADIAKKLWPCTSQGASAIAPME